MAEQRVFVTGATGFVGQRLVRLARGQGWAVLALVLPNDAGAAELERLGVELLFGELGELSSWQKKVATFSPQACLHLGWATSPGTYLETYDNLKWLAWTNELFLRLPDLGVNHIVGVGSCAEYDSDHGYLRECTPTRASTLYAATKLSARMVGERLAERSKIRFSWTRLFHLYGPGEHPSRLVAACTKALLGNERFEATEGRQIRDFLHVDDVAAGIMAVVSAEQTGDINICSGEPISVRDVLKLIAAMTGRHDLLALGTRRGNSWDPPFLCGDNTRLRSCGWQPKFSLETGIADAVSWWRQRIESDKSKERP